MDQKCTPDVVCIVSDCVMNFMENNHKKSFTVGDIWTSKYFIDNVKAIFNKPSATNPTTDSEYDKFIQQPLRMLAYAKVLNIQKIGNKNHYSIANYKILEYISLKDKNAYHFLCTYLEKVLSDSGIYSYFEDYKKAYQKGVLSSTGFDKLKEKFQVLILENTNINGIVEINRIYPKILNIYATQNSLPGTVRGFLSKNQFYYSDLMYNRPNWRDLEKNKNLSRQEAEADGLISENPYSNYLIQKSMNVIRKLYNESEVKDEWSNGDATQIHHIFPKHEFPQLAHYLENLIKLTPTQHYTKAHPKNKTSSISIEYQLVCLLAKADNIEKSIKNNEIYYKKKSFIYCINTGLTKNLSNDLNFKEIKTELAVIYNDL